VPQPHVARLLNDAPGFAGRLEFGAATNLVSEGAGTVVLSVLRFGGTNGTVTLQVAPVPWWIPYSQDFQFAPPNLTFAPGQTSNAFVVTISDDLELEALWTLYELKDSN